MSKQDKILKNYMTPRQWFNFDMNAGRIEIYDMIGSNFWGDGLSSKEFIRQAQDMEKKFPEINIYVNSPGGDLTEALHIYNFMRQSPVKYNGYVEALAASAAATLLMGCDKVYMPPASQMMIHNAWAICSGYAKDMHKTGDFLDEQSKLIGGIYQKRTAQDEKKISKLMDAESYMDGATCVDLGFADELLEDMKAAACAFDLDPEIFPNIPTQFLNYQKILKKRDQEKNLRDGGLSHSQAKKKLAEDAQRDAVQVSMNIQKEANELITKEFSKWLTM